MHVGEGLRLTCEEGVAHVVWDRPPLNVLDTALLERLASVLHRREVQEANAVFLRGGGRKWSAGLSVEEHLAPRLGSMLRAFRAVLRAIWDVSPPTVAVVEGPCLGGGLELLLPCDLALASATATFGQPEILLGVFPPVAVAALDRDAGTKSAADLLFTGRTVGASEAEHRGLVSRVVEAAQLDTEVEALARHFASLRGDSLRVLKRAWQSGRPFPWAHLGRAESTYRRQFGGTPDAEEGLRAFLEKRSPRWPRPGR